MGRPRHWLFKSDPEEFSVEDLKAAPGRTACWDGVRNYQARNFLREEIGEGDRVLFYHSRRRPSIVGVARVVRAGYPDHTAMDPQNPHFDPRSTPENPLWYMVDIRLEAVFKEPLPLSLLRTIPELKTMALLRKGNRLSVQPVTPKEFEMILLLARNTPERTVER